MLRLLVDVGVPILAFTAMLVVGMELTVDDFRRVARRPGLVGLATIGQFVLLPFIGWLLVRFFHLQPVIAQGLLLVTTCPSGAMANVYTFLARANVALSVTLTAVSSMASLLMTPLAIAILQTHTEESTVLTMPIGHLAGQLLLLLILPVSIGMILRHHWPDVTKRHGRILMGVSIAALATLLLAIIVQQANQFIVALPVVAATASILTVLAFAAGWVTGQICRVNTADCFTLGMVFVVRNAGIATAIAVTVLGRSEFAVFGTAYFLAQVPTLLAAVCVFRVTQLDHGNPVPKVQDP